MTATLTLPTTLIAPLEILAVLDRDSMAQLSADLARPTRFAVGTGSETVFETPFIYSEEIVGYSDDSEVLGTTLTKGSGSSLDRITFPSAPGTGTILSALPDAGAVDMLALARIIEQAEAEVRGAVESARYVWPLTGAALSVVRPKLLELIVFRAKTRRLVSATMPSELAEWIRDLATGRFLLPDGTARVDRSSGYESGSGLQFRSNTRVFDGKVLF